MRQLIETAVGVAKTVRVLLLARIGAPASLQPATIVVMAMRSAWKYVQDEVPLRRAV